MLKYQYVIFFKSIAMPEIRICLKTLHMRSISYQISTFFIPIKLLTNFNKDVKMRTNTKLTNNI